jgi:hypothetical protein
MGADAYEIVTREEPEPEGNTRESRTELRNWQKRQNEAHAIIYMGCSDEILQHIKHTVDPGEMWDILHHRFHSTLSKLGRAHILLKFHACRPAKDEKMNIYFTRLIDYRNLLSGSAEVISKDGFVTHLYTHTAGIWDNNQHLGKTRTIGNPFNPVPESTRWWSGQFGLGILYIERPLE